MSKYYAINTPFKNKDIENKLWEGFQKIKKDGSCLKVLEIEVNLFTYVTAFINLIEILTKIFIITGEFNDFKKMVNFSTKKCCLQSQYTII